MQWAIISAQFMIQAVIPDTPLDVETQSQRSEFIVSKLVLFVEDEDFGEEEEEDDSNERLSILHQKNTNSSLFGKKKSSKSVGKPDRPDVAVGAFPHAKPAGGWPTFLQLQNDSRV